MIPKRYGGIMHGLKLIFWEEGIKGLYKGYSAFLLYVRILLFSQLLFWMPKYILILMQVLFMIWKTEKYLYLKINIYLLR